MPYKDPKIAKEKAAERYQKNIVARKAKLKENYLAKREERIAKAKEYAEANKDKILEYQKDWRENNKEHTKEYKKEHWIKNKESISRKQVEYQRNNMDKFAIRQKKYESTEKGKLAKRTYRNNRRCREKNARLGNAFLKETLLIYKACYKMRKEGLNVEVDHIVPISHPDVCGLHVPWNLQIIPAKENRRKTNKFDKELL